MNIKSVCRRVIHQASVMIYEVAVIHCNCEARCIEPVIGDSTYGIV